jgi:hypothetical protein
MESLELTVVNKTEKGVVHAHLKNSGDDLGVLYLTEKQYNSLISIIRTGCFNKEVDFIVEDPYNSEDEEEDITSQNFFTID